MSETPNPFLPGAGRMEAEGCPRAITWSADSVSGTKKPINDDAWLAFASDINGASSLGKDGRHSLESHDLVFAVSDGMGGGNAGDVASRLLLEYLSEMIPRTFKTAASGMHPDYLHHMQQAINAVHLAINADAAHDDNKQGMAATLALAWFTPENLYFCNVGDSRLYVHRAHKEENKTTLLTQDHTFVWKKLNRGEINERQFRSHPRRSALYEVVGGGHRTVNPYLATFPYQSGDRFLLCSDGLIDGLWEKNIHATFLKNSGSTSELTEALMSRAVSNDGKDDTTLISLEVHDIEENS